MASPLASRLPMIDIGINLMDGMFRGIYHGHRKHADDIDAVIARAKEVGVCGLLITAGSLKESRQAIELCQKYNSPTMRCYCTVGCHPTRCGEFAKDPQRYYEDLRSLIAQHAVHNPGGCVAAIGELGLDYDRLFFCEKEVQMPYFIRQLDLAEEFKLPLFLHERNTGGDFERILAEHRHRISGGVVHSFTGTGAELDQLLAMDLYIGINGCSLKTSDNLSVAKSIPIHRLMIETDGPWCEIRGTHASNEVLLDAARRGNGVSSTLLHAFPTCKKEKFVHGAIVKSRCEPCHLVQVLEVLYELHREDVASIESFASTIYDNTLSLFPFEPRSDLPAAAP